MILRPLAALLGPLRLLDGALALAGVPAPEPAGEPSALSLTGSLLRAFFRGGLAGRSSRSSYADSPPESRFALRVRQREAGK